MFLAGVVCAHWPASAWAQEDDAPLDEHPVEIHGFVSQGAMKSTDNNYLANSKRGSLEFAEVGINVTKPISNQLRVGAQLFARDLGPLGNYDARFDWFYLDYRFWDWLGIRAGRTKLPFGLYNETSDIDAARVPVLLPQSIYPTTNRDYLLAQTGLELYGLVPTGGGGQLEYRLYGGTVFFDASDASSQVGDVSVPYIAGGRLMWLTPLSGLQVGATAQALRLDIEYLPPPEVVEPLQMEGQLPSDFDGSTTVRIPAVLGIASIEYAAHDWLIASEYSRWWVSLESDIPALVPETNTTSERAYVMTSYRVVRWFTPGIYYSVLFRDIDDRKGRDAYQHDVAFTTRYDINEHWLLKLEAHYMRGTAALSSSLNDDKPLSDLTENWGLFMAKTTAYF